VPIPRLPEIITLFAGAVYKPAYPAPKAAVPCKSRPFTHAFVPIDTPPFGQAKQLLETDHRS
jgi:hypothetical protein